MNEEFVKIVKSFSSAPFLFIGSGFSRRYYGLPNWEGLLSYFAELVRSNDPSNAYSYYKVKTYSLDKNIQLPSIASLIKADFNEKWFQDAEFRALFHFSNSEDPFKDAIAEYIDSLNTINPDYVSEINSFKTLCGDCVSGIITTNYDNLIEKLTSFTPFIGQTSLLHSTQSGLAEIYKIHGSVDKPNSIVITQEDYLKFEDKEKYLTAKLMTIFLENPVLFIGYSLSDHNILNLLKLIVLCFEDSEKEALDKFQSKLFFVEWNESATEVALQSQSFMLDIENGLNITLNRVIVPNFKVLFDTLQNYRMGIPVKILKQLKSQFAEFVLTNEPNKVVQVVDMNHRGLTDDSLAIYIGRNDEIASTIGLVGKETKDVYLDILYNTLDKFSSYEILTKLLPRLEKGNATLPKYKYYATLSKNQITKDIIDNFPYVDEDTIFNIKNPEVRSIKDIYLQEVREQVDDGGNVFINYNIALRRLLDVKDDFNLEEIYNLLCRLVTEHPDLFNSKKNNNASIHPTYVRKLLRRYDYCRYYKRAMENLSLREEHSP